MRKMSFLSKVLAVTLSLTVAVGTVVTAFAAADSGNGNLTFEKISNPESGIREADGLVPGGDRETSYAWCMAERGDYIYIGTNKNVVGSVAAALANSMAGMGISSDVIWAAIDAYTNGEIPKPTTTEGGYIFRCDQRTGEIKVIYKAPATVAFRMAIEFDGKVYFASYSSIPTADNDILRIDENDNIDTVFTSYNGTSLRAACVHEGMLYFGGVDASETLEPGDEDCQKLAIICKDPDDDTKWTRVADYKDFKPYADDPAVKSTVASPIWDICTYDGYIYASIPNSGGFVLYRGHIAEQGEKANEYGWYWEEIVGKYNGVNNISFAEDPAGNITGPKAGMVSMSATPFTFKGNLYLMDFDNTISAEVTAISGILAILVGQQNVKLSDYLRPMYTTLQNPQKIWRYNDETGKFDEVEGFTKLMEGTCNEYLWRTAEYNGELYISTMDSAVLYNYITKLTNGSFLQMTKDEFKDQIEYIKVLLQKLGVLGNSKPLVEEAEKILSQAVNIFESFENMDLEDAEKFIDKYEQFIEKLQGLKTIDTLSTNLSAAQTRSTSDILNIFTQIKNALDKIKDIIGKIDIEGLKMYIYISDMVADDTWGFDLIKTADGENFEIVTDDGFGNKYNYGGRSLLAAKSGLYVGTANPFFGAQLWRVVGDNDEQETSTEETTLPETTTEETTSEEPSSEPSENPSTDVSTEEDTQNSETSSQTTAAEETATDSEDNQTHDTTDIPSTGSVSDKTVKMAFLFGTAAVIGTVVYRKKNRNS